MKTIRLFTLCLLACALQAMADNKPTVTIAGEPVEGSLVRITFEADNAILEFSDAGAIETDMADVDISFAYEPAPIPTGLMNEELRTKNEEWQGALYDLQGRMINNSSSPITHHPTPLQKGIYIQNGRKIIIK